jgi:hypothetical protein
MALFGGGADGDRTHDLVNAIHECVPPSQKVALLSQPSGRVQPVTHLPSGCNTSATPLGNP